MSMRLESAEVRFGGLVAVRNMDLAIEPARITAVIGPNAAGKSTVLRVLAGVQALHAGTVSIDGVDLGGMPGGLRARFGRPQDSIWESFGAPKLPQDGPKGVKFLAKWYVSKTTVFGRSNLNAKNFDFGMRAFAFPQKAWPRLGGGGVPPWGPSMEFRSCLGVVR